MSAGDDTKDSKEKSGNEDSIKVVARFRPLNDSEERAGSKFVVTFPPSKDDQQVGIGVSSSLLFFIALCHGELRLGQHSKAKVMFR